jgi:branched-subunit amino acid transport protein
MSFWLVMLIAGMLTYAIRLSFILLWGKVNVPEWLQRALHYVPPAVLTAIFVPELFFRNGTIDISAGNDRLIAGLLSALVAWRTRNIMLTIVVGMAALLLLQQLN